MYWQNGLDPGRHGAAHSVVVPYQLFRTADGAAMAGTWGPGDWPKFCEAVERTDLATDPRFSANEDRFANRDALSDELTREFVKRTTSAWSQRFLDAGALFAPLLTIGEAIGHPQAQHLGVVEEIDHAVLGPTKLLRSPIHMSDTPPEIKGPPPVLGQDSVAVLTDLGFDDADVEGFLREGTVLDAHMRQGRP
jgi:formyl-CoA transferase/CoA:oxalate CoA-transferase